jgi:ComEC/Rec2-related protein
LSWNNLLDKISRSPSLLLLAWVGALIVGIAAATGVFPVLVWGFAGPVALGCLLVVIVCGLVIKKPIARLLIVGGLLFCAGVARYLSTAGDVVDWLKYFPFLAAAKNWLVGSVDRLLSEPDAGFMNGLLVGGGVKSPALKAAFVATGTAHVMALSGWNISIINKWLEVILVFLRFGKKIRWLISVTAIMIFVVMTGADSSLVRAAIMSLIVVIAQSSGRRAAPVRAVLYAAALMLLVSPRLIRADIGFLLSVTAMLGMIYFAPFFKPLVAGLPKRYDLSGTIAGTMGATLGTLPVAMFAFGQMSLVALPTNVLLLPFVAPTMALGFVGALLSGFLPSLGSVISVLVGIFTNYDIAVVRLMSRVPGACISNLAFNLAAAGLMVVGMVGIVIKHYDYLLKEKNH